MKKIICLIAAMMLIMASLSACESAGTDSESQVSGSTGETLASSASDSGVSSDPYPINYTEDERITTGGDKKTFDNGNITYTVPAGWQFAEQRLEDGSTISFSEPELGENCRFLVSTTAAELIGSAPEWTEEEYKEHLSEFYQDVIIEEFTTEEIDGHECTKIFFTYMSEGIELKRFEYNKITAGAAAYDFDITYPAADSETYESIFDDIIASIKLTSAE